MDEARRHANLDSWAHTISFFESVRRSQDHARIGERLLPFVEELAASDVGGMFRAGTVLTTLVISCAKQHGLKPDDPYVSVYAAPDEEYRVRYVAPPNQRDEVRCSESELRSTVRTALERLARKAGTGPGELRPSGG